MSEAPKSRSAACLEGNGAGLVREIALAARIQDGLERLYQLDRVADVDEFVAPVAEGGRESLLVREHDDGSLELRLHVPALHPREASLDGAALDPICQIIEGVSHFVYLTERASQQRETTQLEMELQAEVDKYVVLAASLGDFTVEKSRTLRARLFERVAYLHPPDTVEGERYRVATAMASRFVRGIEEAYVPRQQFRALRTHLRRFFHLGQEGKLRYATAA